MQNTISILPVTPIEHPIRNYFRSLAKILLSPSRYFREDRSTLSEALTFGLTSAWITAILAFMFQTMNSILLAEIFQDFLDQLVDVDFLVPSRDSFVWTSGFLLLAPFFVLLRLFLGSGLLYIFALLLADDSPKEKLSYEAVLKIHASCLSSHWFYVVPLFGGFLAFGANILLLTTGFRERFGMSTRRASLVVLAPYILLAFAALLLVLVAIFLATQIPLGDLLMGGGD